MCGPTGICESTRIAGRQLMDRAQEVDWRGHRIAAQLTLEANPIEACFGLALCWVGCQSGCLPAVCCTVPGCTLTCATSCCALCVLQKIRENMDD